jgi:hypothetical protein
MIIIRENNLGTGKKTCASDTLSAMNNPQTDLGLELRDSLPEPWYGPQETAEFLSHNPYIKEEKPTNARLELSCKCHSLYWCLVQNKNIPVQFLQPNTCSNTTLLIVWQWRKLLPRLEVPPSVISRTQTDSVSLSWVTWMFLSPSSYYNDFKDPKMSKQGTDGNRKHVTFTVPQTINTTSEG